MATFVKSGESKTTEEDSSGVRFVKAGSYQAPLMNTESPFWAMPPYGDGTAASLAATRPGQPDQKVGYGEVAKIAGRTGNELAAAATGTIPEFAGEIGANIASPDIVPQSDLRGELEQQNRIFQRLGQSAVATPQPSAPRTNYENPLAGAGAAAREAFGLNIPELQPNPALSPENTPYLDFSGQTPIRNKILRLTGETAGMVPIGAEIAAGSVLAGPLGGGAMAGLAMSAEKFQQGLDAGKSRQEALNEASLSGVGNTALFAIPVAASIAKFLPPTLASRLLTVGVSGLEMGGKMMATGGVDAATNIDNIPMSSEEWKKAYEDVRDGTWNNRSQFLAGALTGAAFGTMTPIGRAKAKAEAKAALDDFIDLGDATVHQREASKEQIGRSGNGLDTQRNSMGRDSGVRFQQQKALPGPALTGPEPQGAITGPDGRPVLAQPRAVGPLETNPVFDPNRQVMPQPEVDALINSLNEQLQARGQRLSVESIPGGQGALGLPPGAERGPMPDPPPAIPLPPPMGVGRPIEEAPSRRAVAEAAPVPAGPAVRPPTPEELALEQQILGADLVDSREIPKPTTPETPKTAKEKILALKEARKQSLIDTTVAQEAPAMPASPLQSAVEPQTPVEATQTAPKPDAEFVGLQERPRGQTPIALYNIPTPDGGFTTVSAETAQAQGYDVPEPPKEAEAPSEAPTPRQILESKKQDLQDRREPDAATIRTDIKALASATDRTRLADIREKLPQYDRVTLDKELIAMQRDGELVLNRNDDPQDITARDEAAKLDINGERRDLVYLTPQKPTTQEKVQALKDRVEEKNAEKEAVYSPETQAIVDAYGGRDKALAVLNRQRDSLRGNEKVSPQTLAAIEELTGGKKTGQADMFGLGEIQKAPKADLPGQTRLPSSDVRVVGTPQKAEYADAQNLALAAFRKEVRASGVRPTKGATKEEMGYKDQRIPWIKNNASRTADQWLERAYDLGLISDAERTEPSTIEKLMSGTNQRGPMLSPEGVDIPAARTLANTTTPSGGKESVSDIMRRTGLTQPATGKASKAPVSPVKTTSASPSTKAQAAVPRKVTVNKLLSLVPNDIVSYDSKKNTISFDASQEGITKVQQAMDKALDSVPQTPTAQAKYEEAYGEIMDAVFSKQEDAGTPSSKPKKSKKRGADPTNPEAGVRLRMTSKDFRDGIKEIGRLLMAGAKSKPTIRFTKGLPEYVWDEAIKMHGFATSYTTRMQQAAADLIQGYRKSLGIHGLGKDIPKEMRELGTQYLEERSPAAKQALLRQFPEEMHAPLRRMRALIDEMTEEWIRNDVVSPAKAQTLKANKGAYVTRQYQTFNDPNYRNVIPSLVRERMRGLLRQWYPEIKNDDVLEGLVNEWVDVSEGEGSGLMWRGSPLGARNFDILKKRENWPQEVLDLWGLEKDVIKNALNTAVKQAKPLAATIFQHNVVKHGRENNYLFSREDIADINSGKAPKAKAEAYGKLVANNNGTWMTEASESNKPGASPYASLGVLGDMYASKDFKKAMHDAMNPTQHVEAIKALIQLNGIAKQALTIESLTTQATNFITNPGFFMGSGLALYDMPGLPGRMKIAAGITMTELKNTSAKSYRDVANRAIQLGVIKEMDNASDISKVVEEGKGGPLSKPAIKLAQAGQRLAHEQKNKAKLALGKAAQLPKYLQDMAAEGRDELVAFYQAGDDFWKALSWLTDTEYQMERNPSLSRAQAEELSAKMIRTYGVPHYSELPSVIQKTRHIPVFNPFGSFPTEAPRILFNQTMQAKGEAFSGNAAETKMAARRFAGQAMAYGIPILTATVSAAMWALSDKDQDTLNDMGPQWDSNSNKAYYAVDRSKGIVKYWNISRASVQSEITDPINALLREEKLSDGTQRALLAVLDPYLQEEIGWKALRQIFENRDDYGRPIWNDADTKSEFAKKIGGVAMGAVQPGTVDSIYRILKDETPVTKLLAEATGQRIRTVDMPKELTYKAKEFMASTRDASMDVKRAEKSGDNAELAEQKRQRLVLHKEKWESLHENVSGMKAFGVDYMRIVASLKSGGMSKKNIDNLINGVYLPPESMQ